MPATISVESTCSQTLTTSTFIFNPEACFAAHSNAVMEEGDPSNATSIRPLSGFPFSAFIFITPNSSCTFFRYFQYPLHGAFLVVSICARKVDALHHQKAGSRSLNLAFDNGYWITFWFQT